MSKSVVDYENLLDASFTDSNVSATLRTSVRPRWERKKTTTKGGGGGGGGGRDQASSVLPGGVGNENTRPPLGGSLTSNSSSLNSNGGNNNPQSNGDRFIPNRAGMNLDLSKHLIRSSSTLSMNSNSSYDTAPGGGGGGAGENNTSIDQQQQLNNGGGGGGEDPNKSVSDAKKGRYDSSLSSAMFGVDDLQNNRVISYTEKAPIPQGDAVGNLNVLYSAAAAAHGGAGSASHRSGKSNAKLVSRQIPSAPSRILDAPDLMDDYYLNLLSWSDTNVLAVALAQTVYLWNAATGDIQELLTLSQEEHGVNVHVSSVAWVQQGGTHLAVGTSSGKTQLWDVAEAKQLRGMDGHTDRVSSLAWNKHVLSSGSRDTNIVQHDVRVARHAVSTLTAHSQEVCGLAWSPDGSTLASGGNDNLLCLWDASTTTSSASSSSSSGTQPLFQFTDHQAAVKALAWSPHERNLLATGGGTADRTIKFWNSRSGALLNSIDTGSQVCALQWNPYEREILSSHGYARNQLCLWKYPTMAKIKELEGHTSRVLHMAVSPDGATVVSAAGDETLRFWNVFAPPPGVGAAAGAGGKRKATASDLYGLAAGTGSNKTRWTTQIR